MRAIIAGIVGITVRIRAITGLIVTTATITATGSTVGAIPSTPSGANGAAEIASIVALRAIIRWSIIAGIGACGRRRADTTMFGPVTTRS